ncbi:MAG: hypothetical protein Q9220_003062 [cf. Caloplaca sp. 1 TL-2023]
MAANLSVLTLPFTAPSAPDFDICDRRYGMGLDIPQCDVVVGRMDIGSESTTYQLIDIETGNCMVSIELAGPHLPATYDIVPDTIQRLANHVINECVGRAGHEGGFATVDISKLIDYVVDPSSDVEHYRKFFFPGSLTKLMSEITAPSSSFLTVAITAASSKKPSPGNYDPIIADTLAGAARDAAMRGPASGSARRTLVQRATSFRAIAMRMSVGRSGWTWWGQNRKKERRRLDGI